jgi:hypothetical protein
MKCFYLPNFLTLKISTDIDLPRSVADPEISKGRRSLEGEGHPSKTVKNSGILVLKS